MLLLKVLSFFKMSLLYYSLEIFVILLIVIVKYLWNKRNEMYDLGEKLPGPKSLPVLGNALTFWCKDEDIFERFTECIGSYPSPMRFWNGLKLCIIFREATQVEKIFSSTTFATKDELYRFLKYFDGEGLISGSGPKWKKDRRLMSPLFLKRNISQYFPVIVKHTKILVCILEEKVEASNFDIKFYLHRASTDFVNETIIGVKSNAQGGELDDLLINSARAYQLIHRRIIKPWLQIDFLYRLTMSYRQQVAVRKVIHGFFWQVLGKAKENHSHLGQKNDTIRTVLEQLLDIRDEVPDFATDEEIIHHLTTLYSASEDTVTTVCAYTLILLGMYPESQKKVADEIFAVMGNENDIREEHLTKLEYLEMVIKETLRLFPIAPFIMRQATQDTELEGYQIPKGTSITVSIFNIHRDPHQWEKPNEFYPEHFLAQAVKNRHPYAYLPFSAGLRGCLGKPYAYMAMKVLLVSIIQKYTIEADGSLQDKALAMDISVRFKDNKYDIRIKRRS